MMIRMIYKPYIQIMLVLTNVAISSPAYAHFVQAKRYIFSDKDMSLSYTQIKSHKSYSNENQLRSKNLYKQTTGFDPAGWMLAGPALDSLAADMQRPYYKALGSRNVPRHYIYYDWGW